MEEHGKANILPRIFLPCLLKDLKKEISRETERMGKKKHVAKIFLRILLPFLHKGLMFENNGLYR